MIQKEETSNVQILLVEDNLADVRLTIEAFKHSKIINTLMIARDGVEAMECLRNQGEFANCPKIDLVLLDLNMPRMDGREVLKEIKEDEALKSIPVVILTTSDDRLDINKSYNHYANCYITKPVDFQQFISVLQDLQNFWISIVKLPNGQDANRL